mmetsp:Transcript_57971/g.160197  ORF Transcript_57971/g.160197 Transcript_57971/m.160197 type:complete len:208 (+) Transcript_57971:673-1296(+)
MAMAWSPNGSSKKRDRMFTVNSIIESPAIGFVISSRSTWKLNAVARTFSSDSSVRTIASKQSGNVVSPCKKSSTSPRAASAPAMSVGPRPPRAEMLVRMSRWGIAPATRSAIAIVPSDPPASTTRISTRSGEPIVLSRLLSTDSIFRASLYAGIITDTRPPFTYGLSGETPGTFGFALFRHRSSKYVQPTLTSMNACTRQAAKNSAA